MKALLDWLAEKNRQFLAWVGNNKHLIIIAVCLLLWAFVYMAHSIFITIKPGNAGVKYQLFKDGTVSAEQFPEGLHVMLPWDQMYIYDVRYQQSTHTIDVLSVDGLKYDIEITVRFRLRPESLGLLHKNIGPQYIEKLLVPVVASCIRREISKYRVEEVYATHRNDIEKTISQWLREPSSLAIDENAYLDVIDLHIHSIVLPPSVAKAIESKMVQQQEMLEYAYRIEREEKEKQRKQIEAEGFKVYNDTIKDSLNDDLVKWLGITSTFELAKSNNSKIVIIDSVKGKYPIIIGEDKIPTEVNRRK
jgi:regulator of protease activity HflC (stomatin/prohibitin superfamily)